MTTNKLSRRQVLRGAGGVTLGLPFLPSLFPRSAKAAGPGGPPRLVVTAQQHGGIREHMYPARPPNKTTMYSGHDIHWGRLSRAVQNGKATVSRIVQGDASVLTERLLSKMNILRGFDSMEMHRHNNTAFGGMTGDEFSEYVMDRGYQEEGGWPSVDQIAANSSVYNPPGSFKERSLVIASGWSSSLYHANPTRKNDFVTFVETQFQPEKMFDKLFLGSTPEPAPDSPRKPLVDHVLENYKQLRGSNRRLSAADRNRLDIHIEMMADLQRRVTAAGSQVPGAGCGELSRPPALIDPRSRGEASLRSPSESIQLYQLYNDLIVAAFQCGVTRVAAISVDPFRDYFMPLTYSDGEGAFHDKAHGGESDPGLQLYFEKGVLDLASKLDIDEGNGETYLDNTIIIYTNDQGYHTHSGTDRPFVTLGGGGGFFKTGYYVDYRNHNVSFNDGGSSFHSGLLFNQFWANVLLALGIPKSEWDGYGGSGLGAANVGFGGRGRGYGPVFTSLEAQGGGGGFYPVPGDYVTGVLEQAGEKLPIVT